MHQPAPKPNRLPLLIAGGCAILVCLGGIFVVGSIVFADFLGKRFSRTARDSAASIQEQMDAKTPQGKFAPDPNFESHAESDAAFITSAERPQPDGQLWLGPDGVYSIVFPDNWTILDAPPDGTVVAAMSDAESNSDNFQENINIVEESFPSIYSGTDYISAMTEQLATLNNFRLISQESWPQGGPDGVRMEYTADMFEFGTSHNLLYVALKPGEAYLITCSSVDANFAKWEQPLGDIAETFRWEAD